MCYIYYKAVKLFPTNTKRKHQDKFLQHWTQKIFDIREHRNRLSTRSAKFGRQILFEYMYIVRGIYCSSKKSITFRQKRFTDKHGWDVFVVFNIEKPYVLYDVWGSGWVLIVVINSENLLWE